MSDFLSELKSINKYAEILDESELGNIKEYISTGSLLLNAKISGDMNKGIAAGRITTLQGKSGVGKSFFAGKIVREAQLMEYEVIWFDSENATDKHFLKRLGVDVKKVHYIPIETIEEFRNQCCKIIDKFEEYYKGSKKLLIVLDSLGNLGTEKEKADVARGHNANDMGLRAKLVKSMTRVLTSKLSKAQIPLLIVNHTYSSADMFSPEEKGAGGEGVVYLSTVIILLSKRKIKDETTKEITGNYLNAVTTKNRLVPERQKASVLVDYKTGVHPYYGLLEYAMKCGLIVKEGTKYFVKHLETKLWEYELYAGKNKKDIIIPVEKIWEPMLKELNEYINDTNKFSSVEEDEIETKGVELLEESGNGIEIGTLNNDGVLEGLIDPKNDVENVYQPVKSDLDDKNPPKEDSESN